MIGRLMEVLMGKWHVMYGPILVRYEVRACRGLGTWPRTLLDGHQQLGRLLPSSSVCHFRLVLDGGVGGRVVVPSAWLLVYVVGRVCR